MVQRLRKKIWKFLKKLVVYFPDDSAVILLDIYLPKKKENMCSHEDLHVNVDSDIIHNR